MELIDAKKLLTCLIMRRESMAQYDEGKAAEDEQIINIVQLFADRSVYRFEPLEEGGGQIQTNLFDTEELHENCTVQILKNSMTGEKSIGWWKNETD